MFTKGAQVIITSNRLAGVPAGSTATVHQGNDQCAVSYVLVTNVVRPNGTKVALRKPLKVNANGVKAA